MALKVEGKPLALWGLGPEPPFHIYARCLGKATTAVVPLS
jgi:hypothetical protein